MSLWQLLKGSGYGGYGEGIPERLGPGKLDPITVAGRCRILDLRRSANELNIPFAVEFLGIIIEYEEFVSRLNPQAVPQPRRVKFTNTKYRDQLHSLIGFSVCEEVALSSIKHFSSYFSVPKDALWDRAIFNGKNLSGMFETPPSTNIPDLVRVVEEIGYANSPEVGLHICAGDLRHWFHQIPLEDHICAFFGIAFKTANGQTCALKWKTLPMGWSYSPLIAQSACWAMSAHRHSGADRKGKVEPLLIYLSGLSQPPMFTDLLNEKGQKVGIVTVYYDNYICVSSCYKTAETFYHRVIRNCNVFNIQLKEHELWHRRDLKIDQLPEPMCYDPIKKTSAKVVSMTTEKEPKPFSFLGIEFGFRQKTGRGGHATYHLEWRVKEKVLPAKCEVCDVDQNFSPRDVARPIGRLLFHRLVSLAPLGDLESTRLCLSLLRRCGVYAWANSWSHVGISITPAESAALAQEWAFVLSRPWHCVAPEPQHICRVATDACDEGYGFVILSDSNEVQYNSQQCLFQKKGVDEDQRTVHREDHIFLKELKAALDGIEFCVVNYPGVQRVDIVTDNTAVAAVLRRKFSSNWKALQMLTSLKIPIRVITVASRDNVADAPSRGLPIDNGCLKRTICAFDLDQKGEKLGFATRHPNVGKDKAGLRHLEGHDDDRWMDGIILIDVQDVKAHEELPVCPATR